MFTNRGSAVRRLRQVNTLILVSKTSFSIKKIGQTFFPTLEFLQKWSNRTCPKGLSHFLGEVVWNDSLESYWQLNRYRYFYRAFSSRENLLSILVRQFQDQQKAWYCNMEVVGYFEIPKSPEINVSTTLGRQIPHSRGKYHTLETGTKLSLSVV